MKNLLCYTFLAMSLPQVALAQITINEIDSDTPGSDSAEFIELFNAGAQAVSLDGYALVFFNGDANAVDDNPATADVDESSPADEAYLVQDLSGQTIPANGFFVFGNPGVANVDLVIEPGGNGAIQNGQDAVALYNGSTAIAFLDGTQTAPTTTDLLDAIIHETGDEDDFDLQTSLGVTEQFNEGELGQPGTQSIQRNPDGSNVIVVKDATPGVTNFEAPRLALIYDIYQISEEDGASAIFGEVRRDGALTDPLTITLTIAGGNENGVVALPGGTVTFDAGQEIAEFTVNAISNATADGDAVISLEVSADGFGTGEASFAVIDDETPFPTLVINELLADEAGPFGDSGPEYIELFNSGPDAITLDGYRIEVFGADPNFTFGEIRNEITLVSGTITPGGFFTIGNDLVSTVYGVTPDLVIPDLDIDDFELSVSLINPADEVVFSALTFNPSTVVINNRAGRTVPADVLISDPDGFEPAGYFLETDGEESADLVEFVLGTGRAPSATPTLSNRTPQIALTTASESVLESSSEGAQFTINRLPNTEDELVISLSSSDSGQLAVPATVTIPSGERTATFSAFAVMDGVIDGSQIATITATVNGLTATSSITVLDSDAPALLVCDVAFVAAVVDNPDFFAVVALAEISGGAQIKFTDNGWQAGGGFRLGEGILTWTAPNEGVPFGSIISFLDNVPNIGTVLGAGPNLAAAGDQLFAYQGPDDAPLLIAGIQMNGDWDDDAVDSNTSARPSILDPVGSIAIVPESDNAVYNGITTGSLAQLKAALADLDNYTTSNTRFDNLADLVVSSFVIGELLEYVVTLGEASFANGQFSIDFVASGASDVYVSTDLESFTLATNGGGVASGSYLDTAPPIGKAFYLIQEAGTPAP